jgi:hypothetical protein
MVTTVSRKDIGAVVEAILTIEDARKITKYVSPTLTIKAARRFKFTKRVTRKEVLLTIGAPNYMERLFIKACLKSGEPFPVKKLQIKMAAKKGKKR